MLEAETPEHDFDGGNAATAGMEELIARRSEPSQCGGFGGLTEQPASAAATARATMRTTAKTPAWQVNAGVMARIATCMFIGQREIVGKVNGED